MWLSVIRSLFTLAVVAGTVVAQGPVKRWSLPDLLTLVDQQSPVVLAARLARDSARAEERIARALPNPQVLGLQNVPYQYGLAWQTDWGPQRRARIRTARLGVGAAASDAADARRRVRAAVREAYYDLLLAEAQRTLAEETREVYRQLMLADSTRLRAGDIAERTAIKSALEYARAEADLARAAQLVRSERLQLQVAVGLGRPDTAFQVEGTLEGLTARAGPPDQALLPLAARPDVQAAALRVTQAQAAEGVARALWLPQPQVSLVMQQGPLRFAPDVPFTVAQGRIALGAVIPLPLLTQYRGERERAAVGVRDAQLTERQVLAAANGEVQEALDAYRSATTLVARYQDGLLRAVDTALAQAQYAYRAGALPLLDVLDAVRTHQDTRSDWLIALHEYWIATTRLLRVSADEPARP